MSGTSPRRRRAAERAARWFDRTRAVPGRLEHLIAHTGTTDAALRDLAARLDSVTGALAGRLGGAGAPESAVDAWSAELARAIGNLGGRSRHDADELRALVRSEAHLVRWALSAPQREAEAARLVSEHAAGAGSGSGSGSGNGAGRHATLAPGLSTLTVTWQHGCFLEGAIASAAAALDRLPVERQGRILVLDNASDDGTAEILDRLATDDPRVLVVRARTNIGLARARNVLLHACTTAHAFPLDADNVADPDGVAALYDAACRTGAVFTFGPAVRVDGHGRVLGVMANEPPGAGLAARNHIDTMSVADVGRYRALGGWTTDPLIEHIDDWHMALHLWRTGDLMAFVPVIAGRYRVLEGSVHLSVTPDAGVDRLRRVTDPDGRLADSAPAAVALVPGGPVVWSTTEPASDEPEEAAPRAGSAGAGAPRILVVGPGGVANLGDDAITAAVCAQVLAAFPGAALDVVTDGDRPVGLPPAAAWVATLWEAVDALAPAGRAERAGSPHRPIEPGDYDLVAFAGGGSLTDAWIDGLIAPRSALAAALASAEVPYVLSGQGIGPLEDVRARQLAASLVSGAARVGCRDDASAACAVALGASPARVSAVGDDALALDRRAGTEPRAGTGAERLVLHLRWADYVGRTRGDLDATVAAAAALAGGRGWLLRALAINAQPAEPEIATLSGAARAAGGRLDVVDASADLGLAIDTATGARAVVSHSYHVALWALAAGVPAVLVAANPYYAAKAAGLAVLAGVPADDFVVPPAAAASPSALGDRLDAVGRALRSGPGLAPSTARVNAWWAGALATVGPSSNAALESPAAAEDRPLSGSARPTPR